MWQNTGKQSTNQLTAVEPEVASAEAKTTNTPQLSPNFPSEIGDAEEVQGEDFSDQSEGVSGVLQML